jgi:hypothetical protein
LLAREAAARGEMALAAEERTIGMKPTVAAAFITTHVIWQDFTHAFQTVLGNFLAKWEIERYAPYTLLEQQRTYPKWPR